MHYEWSRAETTPGYLGETEAAERQMQWYDSLMGDPLPETEKWKEPLLQQYKPNKKKIICDVVASGDLNLISQRAADNLSDIWDRHAFLYPVKLDDVSEPYYMVVVKTEIDGLIRDKSSGKLQKYGPTPDLFAVLEFWEFNEELVGDTDLFVLPDSKTAMYVSERFKARVVEEGLKGFCLKTQFWDENPWIS